ncbi:MAG: pyruvate dehydrogenase (acetyl-transferring), homodimeric type, partial [Patescibacteria group bacterium]|nr:pyruvate dehydrogenase (acetyl-transferring), homodimeric type [Patescibacteria group bacterium]
MTRSPNDETKPAGVLPLARFHETDPAETRDWLDAMDYVLQTAGPDRAAYLIQSLKERAFQRGVRLAYVGATPYVNTIPVEQQPEYPGDRDIERRIKSILRWNAMAMVVRANKRSPGIGGHISTFASAATLYEVAFNHFFRGKKGQLPPDQVFFQGHATPGIYARAWLLGRLQDHHLLNFRRELQPEPGLSSYPPPK